MADGAALPLRRWKPALKFKAPKAVIIALHGFNDYSKALVLRFAGSKSSKFTSETWIRNVARAQKTKQVHEHCIHNNP